MSTTAAYPSIAPTNWFRRTEAWLDSKGRAAWIAAMVLGFILFWPVGLALLAYMIWGKRMFGKSCRHRSHGRDGLHHDHSRAQAAEWAAEWGRSDRTAYRPSGNSMFDSYKADTLRRLEEEQEAFESFLQRLRQAKDKTEFDTFMDDRAKMNRDMPEAGTPAPDAPVPPATDPDARRGAY